MIIVKFENMLYIKVTINIKSIILYHDHKFLVSSHTKINSFWMTLLSNLISTHTEKEERRMKSEGDRKRETNPTCSEDWPKAEPSSPFRVKNERPASNETSVWGLNNGKTVLSGEMNTFSAYTWKKGNKVSSNK